MKKTKTKKPVSDEKARLVRELHAPVRRRFPRRRVITRGIYDLWQADLVDMRAHVKQNRGHNYMLTCIDVFSKFAWALPIRTKNGKDVTEAFAKILKSSKKPKNLQTDDGKEFFNSNFQNLMREYGINHYSTFSTMKASVVERLNRTFRENLWKMFSLNGDYRWIDSLPELVKRYNERKHSTIKMRPADVTAANAGTLLSTVYNRLKIAGKGKFKVGDPVRISKYKSVFDKGYTPNWSTEVFRVIKVQITNPVTYLLRDSRDHPIKGAFYEAELHSVKNPDVYLVERILRKKGKKVYVKWLGLDAGHNSWIDDTNVL